jgi:exonuclease SbcC
MRIAKVDLENVKSYRRQSVTFTSGTNAICGPNGAGKSTLLEAIGFALFGFLPYTRRNFVREGEKTATVTVHLVSDDGRAYQVVRKCGSSSQYYIYDPEIGKLTTSREDTTAWLYEFFGVEETGNLPALFEDAVGVPQGLLTAAFLDRAANRKNTFNPLLRVDEYEEVWKALLEPRRRLDGLIAEQREAIAGYEAEVKALPDLRSKVSDLLVEIETDEKRRAALKVELEDVTRRKEALEAVVGRLDKLERQVTQAEGEVKALQARLNDAQDALERARAAQEVVRETKAGHQAYLEAHASLEELEIQRKERDRLREEAQGRATDLALARQQVENLESELSEIADAEARMAELHPQVEEQARVEAEWTEASRDADRLAGAERSLTQERRRLADLKARLSETQAGLEELAEVEREITPLQAELDDLDGQHNTLSTQLAACRAELGQLVDRGARAVDRLSAARRRLSLAQERLADLESRLSEVRSGLVQRNEIEETVESLRGELEAVEARYGELTTQVATNQAELDQICAQVGVLEASEAAECPVCSAPLTPEHRSELLAQHRVCQAELEETLAEARSQCQDAEKTRRQKRGELGELEEWIRELPRPAEREELAARVDAQRDEVSETEKETADAQVEVSDNETRQGELEATVSDLQGRLDDVGKERRETRESLDKLEERRQALPRPGEVESLVGQVSQQEGTVAEAVRAVEALAGAPDEVKRLETELAELGDPRRAYRRAADTAAQREEVGTQLKETRAGITDLEAQIAALGEQLGAYADLDARIEEQRVQEAEHEPAHQRYLEHIREAEALQDRQESVDALSSEMQEARSVHDRLVQEHSQVAGEYDADAYKELDDVHGSLSTEQATLSERLRLQRGQVEGGQAEIERLEGVGEQLDAANAERDELDEVLILLNHLRHVLRDAGPKITQALVEVISLQAARLYADIMADHTARLRWTEDYEILLNANGRERTFKQLSGGEQMSAALSVRLALLREVSDIDVAFFDEPTANLDETRRDNLAEQIMKVKGFSQLFVISHDDTFERDTDNVVRVVKEDGVSRVEG